MTSTLIESKSRDQKKESTAISVSPTLPSDSKIPYDSTMVMRATLKPRADNGDLAAAVTLVRAEIHCWWSDFALRNENVVPLPENPDPAKVLKRQETHKLAETLRERCVGFSASEWVKNLNEDLLVAAKLGDSNSTACYIQAEFGLPNDANPEQQLAQYKKNAWDLIRAGMSRGDWTVIDLMKNAFNYRNGGRGAFGKLVFADPVQEYQYMKLLSLGKAGDDESYKEGVKAAAAKLPPAVASEKDAWAQDMYQKYYAGSPRWEDFPSTCHLGLPSS